MLTIGTDCSGIEAPIEALKQLKIEFEHEWSCEIDKFARKSILANYHPKILYEDITTRDHSKLPDIDIYVCGFPCQSFSLMGKKLGTKDPRSNIMLHCISVIKNKQPNIFILENVKNFKFIEKGKPFNYLIKELSDINEYNIYYDIYNTKDYGIPQNRERIYIVGIKKDIQVKDFQKPNTITMIPLEDFIINKTIYSNNVIFNNSLKKNLEKIDINSLNIVLGINYYYPLKNLSPTLTTQCSKTFVTPYNRCLTIKECLLLQGFKSQFKQVVSNTQMYKQIGNSMSVNVLKVIFQKIFESTIYKEFLQ